MKQGIATINTALGSWLDTCTRADLAVLAHIWRVPATLDALAATLGDADAVQQFVAHLTPQQQAALHYVQARGGRVPALLLEREFGVTRPHNYLSPRSYLLALQQPPSATEFLFITGLLGIEATGRQRYYVVPQTIAPLLPPVLPHNPHVQIVPAPAPQRTHAADLLALEYKLVSLLSLAHARELSAGPDGMLTKLSLGRIGRRWGIPVDDLRTVSRQRDWPYLHCLLLVLRDAGLLRLTATDEIRPTADAVVWLNTPRVERLQWLLDGWVTSGWDELTDLLGYTLSADIEQRNVAVVHRAVLEIIRQLPANTWITWPTLWAEVRRVLPDFARPDGDYDSWGLTNALGQSRDGFAHWGAVEGALLQATIGTTWHWLGLVDIGSDDTADGQAAPASSVFRLNPMGAAVLGIAPTPAEPAAAPLVVQSTYDVIVPPHVALASRFQISRIAEWQRGTSHTEATYFKLTKRSVQAALEQGVALEQITAFLEAASAVAVPSNVAYSVREWSQQHGQVRVRRVALVQTTEPLLLERIHRDHRVRVPAVEQLDATTWAVPEADATSLVTALRKAGYGVAGDVARIDTPFATRDLTMLAAALTFYTHACERMAIASDVNNSTITRLHNLLSDEQQTAASRIARAALDYWAQPMEPPYDA